MTYDKITQKELDKVVEDCIQLEENLEEYVRMCPGLVADRLTDHAYLVACFAKLAGQDIPSAPTIPDERTRILRAKLIMEEALETVRGLGVAMSFWNNALNIEHMKAGNILFFKDDFNDPNLKEIVDGCLDLRVVTTGTLIACGVTDSPDLQETVDVNNIVKFRKDKDGYKREDGKWVKPSDHPAPKIQLLLDLMTSRASGEHANTTD